MDSITTLLLPLPTAVTQQLLTLYVYIQHTCSTSPQLPHTINRSTPGPQPLRAVYLAAPPLITTATIPTKRLLRPPHSTLLPLTASQHVGMYKNLDFMKPDLGPCNAALEGYCELASVNDAEKYFCVLMLWNEVKRKASIEGEKRFKLDHSLVDVFLYALVRRGFFDAVMQVVEKSQETKIFVDKCRYKQAFMEKHKKLKVSKLRKRNFRKKALVAFKNWAWRNIEAKSV